MPTFTQQIIFEPGFDWDHRPRRPGPSPLVVRGDRPSAGSDPGTPPGQAAGPWCPWSVPLPAPGPGPTAALPSGPSLGQEIPEGHTEAHHWGGHMQSSEPEPWNIQGALASRGHVQAGITLIVHGAPFLPGHRPPRRVLWGPVPDPAPPSSPAPRICVREEGGEVKRRQRAKAGAGGLGEDGLMPSVPLR